MVKKYQGRPFLLCIPSGVVVKTGFYPHCLPVVGKWLFPGTSLRVSSFRCLSFFIYMTFSNLFIPNGLFAVCLLIFRLWVFYLNIWLTLVWRNPDGWNSGCALQERICFQNLCWVPRDHLSPLQGALGAARISLLPLYSHHHKFRLLFYSYSRVGSSALGKPWLSWLSAAPISAFVPLFLSFVCMWHSLGTHVFAWVPESPYFPATPAVN